MAQNWIDMNGVKMNIEVADYLKAKGLFLIMRAEEDVGDQAKKMSKAEVEKDGYPWIACWPKTCPLCGRIDSCTCPRAAIPMCALHLFAWDFLRGATNPRKKGEVIHHKNRDKKDARIKNLGKGTRREHGLAHKARRQKFSKRNRHDLRSVNFRPRQPARVVTRTELIGRTEPIPPKAPPMPSKARHIRDVEQRLAGRYDELSTSLAHLDSCEPITKAAPAPAWRSPRTRMLGLKAPRLDLTDGEAAFVLLLVQHRFDLEKLAEATGEHVDLLRDLLHRPAVDEAVRRWRRHRRLPLAKAQKAKTILPTHVAIAGE